MSTVISGRIFKGITSVVASFTADDVQIGDVVTFEGGDQVGVTDEMDGMFKGYSLIDGAARYFTASEVRRLDRGRFATVDAMLQAIKGATR